MKQSPTLKTLTAYFLLQLLFQLLFVTAVQSQGNSLIEISGRVTNEQKQGLSDVSVQIKGTVAGTITNKDGDFKIRTKLKLPLTLVFSSIGFQAQEFAVNSLSSNLQVALVTQTYLGNDVVVTASRVPESILKSPVAIEKLDIRAIRESPAPSFYDALETVKGVQMTTSSLTFKVPNTRGFNIPNNFRFMQLVDGVDMQAATLGVPLGNAIGPTELDIQSVEITPGAASALYGMNAINGMANLITKSPFTDQGLSFYQKSGINHVGGTGRDLSNLTETAIRYAKAFNNKVAFKFNGSYLKGTDWLSDTRKNQNPNNLKTANPLYPELNDDNNNTVFDGWNKYGDDALAGSNTVSITGLTVNGQSAAPLTVARTGYWEKDLVNPTVDNLKFDAALHFRPSDHVEISYGYRFGKMDGVFQRGNKVQLDNVIVQNHKVEVKGDNFLVRGYVSLENTGDSYNVKPTADNMDLFSGGSNNAWATKYKNALTAYGSSNGGLNSANFAAANKYARAQADASRAEPGTARFDSILNVIRHQNNWDIQSALIPDAPVTGGSALIQKSRMYHVEGQWDLSKAVKVVSLLVGGDARIYQIIPDGNNFVDFSRSIEDRNKALPDGSFGKNVLYKKYGGFAQVTKTFLEEKLKLFASLRYDYNPEFKGKFTPRVAAVYTVDKVHNFRVTYQQGYRFPALFEALSYVNNGRVKRVGSLSYINNGLGYLENSYTQSSVVAFNAAVKSANSTDAAALANRNLLVVANLPEARPERIKSLEFGYKSVLLHNKLTFDIDAYTNTYDGFLGQVQVFVPKGEKVGADAGVLAMLDRNRDAIAASSDGNNAASKGQDRYRVYTNAKNSYTNYGIAIGTTYNFYKRFTIGGNTSFNKLKSGASDDIFVTGFNTPEWTANISFSNREVVKNLGFSVVYKWQKAFLWESPLVTGTVPAINSFDAQITLRVPEAKTTLKIGGSNIFNSNYIQYAGGPTLGGLYYAAITIDGLLSK